MMMDPLAQGEEARQSGQVETPKSVKKILAKALNKPSKALALALECATGKNVCVLLFLVTRSPLD